MQYVIRDHTLDLTCTVDELHAMWERGQRIYGGLPSTANQTRVLHPYIAAEPRYHYDPILATWEDFNLPDVDGSGILTVTVARDPERRRGPRVTGADRDGQLTFFPPALALTVTVVLIIQIASNINCLQ